jgi:predicted metalloprotease
MRLDDVRESVNVQDRRGVRLRRGAVGGGAAVVALVLALLGAPRELVQQVLQGGGSAVQEQEAPVDPAQAPVASRTKRVLTTTEQTWSEIFQRNNRRYEPPTLYLFSGAVQSACGMAGAAVGPFYCPADRKVYIDLSFFEELDRRFGAPGDFAQGYVVAHEVGHHVQNLTGVADQVHARRSRVSEVEGNRLQVKMELQADCYAGIWAREGLARNNRLEDGDIQEGLRAAEAIGDDTLQRKARGQVVPESFTHGSSAQRMAWFRKGFDTGQVSACDTFRDASL